MPAIPQSLIFELLTSDVTLHLTGADGNEYAGGGYSKKKLTDWSINEKRASHSDAVIEFSGPGPFVRGWYLTIHGVVLPETEFENEDGGELFWPRTDEDSVTIKGIELVPAK